jgi:peptide/nickel transport system permease protein
MTNFIIRRIIQSIIVLVLITAVVFIAVRLLPGDPIMMYISSYTQQQYTQAQIQLIRHEVGLDKPMPVQYYDWVTGLLHGNLGTSILRKQPVTIQIFQSLPVTAYVCCVAFIIGILIGLPLGIITAVRRGKWIDTLLTLFAYVGITIPVFWLGLILMYVFGVYLKWLPVMGYTSPFDNFWMSTKQLIMPVICLSFPSIAMTSRQTRSSLLEVMRQDYIRTAYSKGLRERVVIWRHALKNSLIPIVTLVGLGVPMIIGGNVLVEEVFNLPGIGVLMTNAVFNADYPYVQGIVLIISVVVLVTNLLVELTYGWLDPRIRYD